MHKLRIIISDKPKMMINSPEVCLDITRQHAQVGHKNINIFIYKNHLGRFYINGKQFIEKYLLHNFVQVLAHELVMIRYTTYPKFGCRGFMVFELWQI
jgi:ABC-type antimicrobial peptide transport system ATPase subunit